MVRGLRAGWGGSPSIGSPPFLPWRSALRDACPGAAAPLESSDGGAQDARFRLFETVTAQLVAQAESTPMLLVLDDLQWADERPVLEGAQLGRAHG